MIKKLSAIVGIFLCASVAWVVLGSTILSRTYSSDAKLKRKVQRIWGTPQSQVAPSASYSIQKERKKVRTVDGKREVTTERYSEERRVPLMQSDVDLGLSLEHRQKGLLWYSTYKVRFSGKYRFKNTHNQPAVLKIVFPFPSAGAIYDDFAFSIEDANWLEKPIPTQGQAVGRVRVPPGREVTVRVGYRSQGLDDWTYRFGTGIEEVNRFNLVMDTDFRDIDFPDDSISPTSKEETADGWRLKWSYKRLLAGVSIGMAMPQRLQPGPLAGKISFFAPVSLFFFIVVLFTITAIRGIRMHPMHYLFLSGAFFAFHLLLAYLVDHVSIHAGFAISAVVSLGLVVSYLRLVVSDRFAFVEAGGAQLMYLVLFSYAFFFKGITGLAITVGAIVTLFLMMQVTAKLDWDKVFEESKG
ncbi:inner membrane CreD family protein [Elusimicrobiota bacterium]